MFSKKMFVLATAVSSLGFGIAAPNIHADNVATATSSQTLSSAQYTDGTYQVNTTYLKQGTNNASTMGKYMSAVSNVTIKGNTAKLTISANSASSAKMITGFSINGTSGVKNGNSWTFTLPTSVLENTLNGHVDINAIFFTESQPVDVKLDMSSVN